jgi:hypothetical protein
VEVILYTNGKDKKRINDKKAATKSIKRATNLFIAFFVHL